MTYDEHAVWVTRRCEDCGSDFLLPREFTGTQDEWVCPSCLNKASEAFRKHVLKVTWETDR